MCIQLTTSYRKQIINQNADTLAAFLRGYFKYYGLSSSDSHFDWIFFSALLICMEKSFWNINGNGNFINSFKDSITLYFVSGMWKKVVEDIGILKNGPHGFPVTKDFEEEFCKFIVEHYLFHPEPVESTTWLQRLMLQIFSGQWI